MEQPVSDATGPSRDSHRADVEFVPGNLVGLVRTDPAVYLFGNQP
jgi:hypothetical protein